MKKLRQDAAATLNELLHNSGKEPRGQEELGNWDLVCPVSGRALSQIEDGVLGTADGRFQYVRRDGIWDFLPEKRAEVLGQFVREYETVRSAEKRGVADAAYFAALPYKDTSGLFSADWAIRARSFDCMLAKALPKKLDGLKIVDLGAGNGWLSGRLAKCGAQVAAVDLMTNQLDGLGAHVHYDPPFTPMRTEFLSLPFAANSLDVIIFNASLHYVANFETLFANLLPMLRQDGRIVIVDTPFYHNAASGVQMVAEREAAFLERFGFASDAQQSENFMTWGRLSELSKAVGFGYVCFRPKHPLRMQIRPIIAKLRRRREPARFPVVVIRSNS